MRKLIIILTMLMLIPAVSAEVFKYNIGGYETYERGEYTLVYINNGNLIENDLMLYQPVGEESFEIASDKAIKDVRIIEKNFPVKLRINVPELDFYSEDRYHLVDRDCFTNTREAWIDYSTDYDEVSMIDFKFYPLQMDNCLKNEFTLYQEIIVLVEYYETDKISVVQHSDIKAGQPITFNIEFTDINGKGDVLIYNPYDLKQPIERKVTSNKLSVTLDAPDITEQLYIIEYYEDDLVDIEVISSDLKWGKIDFRILKSENPTVFPLVVEITNTKEETIPVTLDVKSVSWELEEGSTMTKIVQAPPGKKIFIFDFDIEEEEENNDVEVYATHDGIEEYVAHNSFVRITRDQLEKGLPPTPAEQFGKDVIDILEEERAKQKKGNSTTLGIIIAIILFAALGYFVYRYLRGD